MSAMVSAVSRQYSDGRSTLSANEFPYALAKLTVRDRVQAVVLAYEAGLVTPGRV